MLDQPLLRPCDCILVTHSAHAVQMEMVREAHHLVGEFKEHKKHALLNLLSDSVAGTTFFVTLAGARNARAALFSTLNRIWGGLSDTAKAFIIIASAPRCCLLAQGPVIEVLVLGVGCRAVELPDRHPKLAALTPPPGRRHRHLSGLPQ